ncbi:hypothetical protein [Marinobacterium aestuariivivens]|uniref:Periplasmic binding protein domain-containing protein n=1 Tax=Marinobacterium aestuariivivens TaxID=1698799 RepID=A0ABW2A468_9GAMM
MDPQTPDHKGPRPGWFALLLVWLLASLANASPLQNYRPLEQYLQSHPEQLPLMEAFAARVRAEPVPLQARQQQPVRIAMIYPAIQTSDYWRRSVAALERRLDALRIDYRLLLQYSSPTDSAELLAGQLREALDWQPDYLVFTLDALPHRHMIERLLLRQRPRLILQNITTPLQDWSANPPFLYVGFDHRIGTRLLAREMLLQAGPGARYSTLYFSHGYISQMRGGTFVAMAGAVPGTRALGATTPTASRHAHVRPRCASWTCPRRPTCCSQAPPISPWAPSQRCASATASMT